MKCKVCNKEMDKHSFSDVSKCLQDGFSISWEGVLGIVDRAGLVLSRQQNADTPGSFILFMSDGSVKNTENFQLEYARLALTQIYTKPQKSEVHIEEEEPLEEG